MLATLAIAAAISFVAQPQPEPTLTLEEPVQECLVGAFFHDGEFTYYIGPATSIGFDVYYHGLMWSNPEEEAESVWFTPDFVLYLWSEIRTRDVVTNEPW